MIIIIINIAIIIIAVVTVNNCRLPVSSPVDLDW